MVRRPVRALLLVCALGLLVAAPAHAAYPAWTAPAAGTAPVLYQGTLAFNAIGFPSSATYTITLSGPSAITVNPRLTNADGSNNIAANGPWGSRFGATQAGDGLYIEQASSAADTTVQTTIDFPTPLAPGRWGIAVGDIDVERAVVGGLDASSNPLAGAQLQGAVPTGSVPFTQSTGAFSSSIQWNPAARTATNPSEVSGRAIWLQPDTTLSRFTVNQCREGTGACRASSSSNSLRVWVGLEVHALTANVTYAADGEPAAGALVQLFGPGGTLLASTTTGASGSYTLPSVYAQPGYVVKVTPPAGYGVSGSPEARVDLDADATVGFKLVRAPTAGGQSAADSTPGPGATIDRARKRTPTRVATPVTTEGAGTITQHGTARWDGGDARTVCRSQRVVRRAAEVTLVCQLNTQARLALGRQSLQLRLVTVFTASDGARTRKVQTLTLARFTPSATAVTG